MHKWVLKVMTAVMATLLMIGSFAGLTSVQAAETDPVLS